MTSFNLKTGALSLVAIFLVSACGNTSDQAQQQGGGMPVRTTQPEKRVITEWDEFTGRFHAAQRVDIQARVSGYLDEIHFNDGQIVQKDDTLFVIDQRPYKIALDRAQANYDLAKKEFDRAEMLIASEAISVEEYDRRLQQMRTAKAAFDEAQLNLKFTEVKAPFTGRIARNLVDIGTLITGGTHLTTLVNNSPIELYFDASEDDLLRYTRASQKGDFTGNRTNGYPVEAKLMDEDNYTLKGRINYIGNELDRATGTLEIRAIFDNEEDLIEHGMFGRLRLAMSEPKERLLIPQDVIGTQQTLKFVYVVSPENTVAMKYVQLGQITEDGKQIVHSGLDGKEAIIAGGLQMLQPGMPVTPMPTQPAPTQSEKDTE